ncbi:cupin domain-containing protein [Actinokineospora xionganensis]|uniref:cupin domain-containing protein n=1 Tax=Actinokineospora xionganensis TaxID=2684470 RepID=UPI0028AA4AAD|nr:cupin domain-containing protein [Actinokineospora xionganensis]
MSLLIKSPADVERLRAVVGEYRVLLSGADTGGRLAVVEQILPPGALGAAPHVHHGHEEDFIVTAGAITFDTATEARVVAAGGVVSVPRGAAHGFGNDSAETARCIVTFTPAGYEDYFRLIDELVRAGTSPDADTLARLRARFATESATH